MAGAFFVSEVFDCSFYPTGRVIATQKAPAHFCATARNVGSHYQIPFAKKRLYCAVFLLFPISFFKISLNSPKCGIFIIFQIY